MVWSQFIQGVQILANFTTYRNGGWNAGCHDRYELVHSVRSSSVRSKTPSWVWMALLLYVGILNLISWRKVRERWQALLSYYEIQYIVIICRAHDYEVLPSFFIAGIEPNEAVCCTIQRSIFHGSSQLVQDVLLLRAYLPAPFQHCSHVRFHAW